MRATSATVNEASGICRQEGGRDIHFIYCPDDSSGNIDEDDNHNHKGDEDDNHYHIISSRGGTGGLGDFGGEKHR